MIIKYRPTFFHDACCTDNLEWGEQMIYISAFVCTKYSQSDLILRGYFLVHGVLE